MNLRERFTDFKESLKLENRRAIVTDLNYWITYDIYTIYNVSAKPDLQNRMHHDLDKAIEVLVPLAIPGLIKSSGLKIGDTVQKSHLGSSWYLVKPIK